MEDVWPRERNARRSGTKKRRHHCGAYIGVTHAGMKSDRCHECGWTYKQHHLRIKR